MFHPTLNNTTDLWFNGNKSDAIRDLLKLNRPEQEAFASAVLDGNPQHIIAAILLARLTVSPSEAAANECYDHNHDDRYEN